MYHEHVGKLVAATFTSVLDYGVDHNLQFLGEIGIYLQTVSGVI